MEGDLGGWSLTARRLLQRIRQPAALEADADGIALRDALGAATVFDAVRSSVDRALANGDPRLATIVQRCDLDGDTVKAVAREFNLSLRHLFRFRASVFDALGGEMKRTVDAAIAVPRDERKAEALRLLTRVELLLSLGTAPHDRRAIAAAEAALRLDPSLVDAWCAVGWGYIALALNSSIDTGVAYERAAAAADRAEELAPGSGNVLAIRGSLALGEHDLRSATALAEQALANPRSSGRARAQIVLGWAAAFASDFDRAERHFRAACAAAPTNPRFHAVTAAVLHLRGDYAKCVERCRELQETVPEGPFFWGYYTEALNALGAYRDTIAVANAAPRSAGNFALDAARARAHAMLGDVEGARSITAEFRGPAMSVAAIALSLNDEERLWRALERAREQRNGMLELAPYDPVFKPLWDDAKFRRLTAC